MLPKLLGTESINKDIGLLVLRVGVGLSMLVLHGYGKITGGPGLWGAIGGNAGSLGLGLPPVFLGFMAAFAEFFCSILLILGVLFRPALLLLGATMFVAITVHLNKPPESPYAGWKGASHALDMLIVYVALFLTGPGRYAFSLILKARK